MEKSFKLGGYSFLKTFGVVFLVNYLIKKGKSEKEAIEEVKEDLKEGWYYNRSKHDEAIQIINNTNRYMPYDSRMKCLNWKEVFSDTFKNDVQDELIWEVEIKIEKNVSEYDFLV